MKPKTKSPLERRPNRLPGQSVDEEIARVRDGFFDKWLVLFAIFFSVTVLAWIIRYTGEPPNPWLLSGITLLIFILVIRKGIRVRQQIRRLRQGRDGERVVGNHLERCRAMGYDVFHDVVIKKGNIDHVLVGPGGAFTIETKTYSKPDSGNAVIHYDARAERLLKGRIPLGKELRQAKAEAYALSQLLKEHLSDSIYVHPVLLFPGWRIDSHNQREGAVRVFEPSTFMQWLESRTNRLPPDRIVAVRRILKQHLQLTES